MRLLIAFHALVPLILNETRADLQGPHHEQHARDDGQDADEEEATFGDIPLVCKPQA